MHAIQELPEPLLPKLNDQPTASPPARPPAPAEQFCEIVKKRNQLARLCGAEDYYDMKVGARQWAGAALMLQR